MKYNNKTVALTMSTNSEIHILLYLSVCLSACACNSQMNNSNKQANKHDDNVTTAR